jgi:hypothetical protein
VIDLINIFCEIDDFCKEFNSQFKLKNGLSTGNKRKREMSLTMSEVMTISIWYHFSGYTTFKDYYTKHVQIYLRSEFPKLVSYNRFIELRKMMVFPTLIFVWTKKLSSCTAISFIDSFKLEACHIKRASSHKTLLNIAKKGKTSMGWFYGMKVHIVINPLGEIVTFSITPGNVADNNEQLLFTLTKKLKGKLFGDKGYLISEQRFQELYNRGIQIITKIRHNMKNKLMLLDDKLILRSRGIVESVGNILKKHFNMEHTRHRSVWGFFLHIFTSLTAYQMRDKKPHLSCDVDYSLLIA